MLKNLQKLDNNGNDNHLRADILTLFCETFFTIVLQHSMMHLGTSLIMIFLRKNKEKNQLGQREQEEGG
jgi:hypothetical protein